MNKRIHLIIVALFLGGLFYSFTSPQCQCKVYVPNAFSPDGRGEPENDAFRPILPTDCQYTEFEFQVFDRWGKLVFKSNLPEEGWDGTFNGQLLAANVYVYVIRLQYADAPEGKPEILTGDVALIR